LIQRLLLCVAAVVAFAAAAAVAVFAAAFGLYALLVGRLGPAGAAGALVGAAALLMLLLALAAWIKSRPPRLARGKPQGDPMERIVEMARERPIIAAGALVAAAMVAMRNPAITAMVFKSFFDSKKRPTAR
jgi:hypothetical protein